MATKNKIPLSTSPRTALIISRKDFKSQLEAIIERGIELEARPISTILELNSFKEEYADWNDFNSEFLKSSFNNTSNEYKHKYDACTSMLGMDDYASGRYRPNDPNYQLKSTNRALAAKLSNLRQLLNKADLIPSEVDEPLAQLNIDGIDPIANLHPTVRKVAGKLFVNGHYRQAMLDTYIALSEAVKAKSGLNTDNTPLMQGAFSPKNPILNISSDSDEQLGFMWLFSGAMMALRNPNAHRLDDQKHPQETLEWLTFASALFRTLDKSH